MGESLENFVIRPMEAADVPFVAKLEQECFSKPWSEKSFMDAVDSPLYQFFVGYENGEHVATVGLILSEPEAEISNVAVKETYRKGGRAGKLLKEAFRYGRNRGITRFLLEVREQNVPAIRLYESLDFKVDGRRKSYYTDPVEDAILMSRDERREVLC